MTSSSKPEVVAWSWAYRGRHMATTDYSQALELAEPPYPTEVEPLIRLADYQRLQADHERLQAECEEELFCVRQDRDTHFGEMMRAIEQVDAMKAECEELRTALAESRANDLTAMGYLNQIRQLVGGDDLPDMVERVAKLQAECENLRKDSERIEWLGEQTKKSYTGISFDYHRYVEDGYVVDHGYRFMRRHFASGFKDSLRKAIDAAMEGDKP